MRLKRVYNRTDFRRRRENPQLNMPAPAFFRQLGFFVENNFIDSSACARIENRIRAVKTKSETVFGNDRANAVVNENVRKTLSAKVEEEIVVGVSQRLQNLQPRLEEH